MPQQHSHELDVIKAVMNPQVNARFTKKPTKLKPLVNAVHFIFSSKGTSRERDVFGVPSCEISFSCFWLANGAPW